MTAYEILLFILIAGVMVLSTALRKLTAAGAGLGGLLALGVYVGAGFTGIAMLGGFFVLGTIATGHKRQWKEQAGIAEAGEQTRTAAQVFANGGVAALTGAFALVAPHQATLLQMMMAASLASAAADTVSSELGVVYGRNFYNICTFKREKRGLDGVVSLEGMLLGICGSLLIAMIYAVGFGFDKNVIWIVVAGTVGNLVDSVLGATLERSHFMNNNAVNFCNTLVAALVVLLATPI
jgi:uncharacterized protein (TIGR00297 family)